MQSFDNLNKENKLNKFDLKFGLIPIIGILAVILLYYIGASTFINVISKALGSTSDSTVAVQIEDIEFSFDQENWLPYNNFLSTSKYDRKNEIYIRGTFPDTTIVTPTLFLHTKNNYANLTVYDVEWGSNLKNYVERSTGDVFNIFKLSNGYEGKDFLLTLRSSNPDNVGLITKIEIRQKFSVYSNFLYEGISLTIFSIFSILIGVVIVLSFSSKKYRNDGFHYIGIFSILIGLFWYSNINIFSNNFFHNSYTSTIFSYFILYLFPLPVIKYIKKFDMFNAALYDNLFLYYLAVLILILGCDALKIINLEDWFVYNFIFFVMIIILALYVYFFKIFNTHSDLYLANKSLFQIFTLPFFTIEILAVAYDMYIIFNSTNIITENQITPFLHTIFLMVSLYAFANDFKSFNNTFITNSEKIKLNKICINKLVTCQEFLFSNLSYDTLKDNYIDTITEFLYPTKNQNMVPIKDLISSTTYNDFYKNYNDFLMYSSSYIYMTKPESMYSAKDEKAIIISASGIYKPFIDTDPYETMNLSMLTKFKANLESNNVVTDNNIILRIGSSDVQHGVMVFENISYLTDNQIALLESYMSTVAILLENDFLLNIEKKSQANTVYNLNEFSELRSKETGNHIRRVALYSRLLGIKFGLSEQEYETLHLASSMHDIGKINIPDEILNKPGKLTNDEFEIMRTHSFEGYKILRNIKNPIMEAGSIVAYYHHERYDGTGLFGLKGDEIPIFARIVAVADVFDALLSERVYKKAWHLQAVLELFEKERDKQFDGRFVDILFESIDEMLEIKSTFADNIEF